ncbi:ubiquitin-conjugating enzyme family protein [Streptomyces sp. NPDC017988]|uniref:ubiquitin-conjugating enzyme family protein n=1 Tax=Streptomyces sp. NPDC017988 TaxID=3365025 RepID=UPI00378793B5
MKKGTQPELKIDPAVGGDLYRWSAELTPSEESVFHDRRFKVEIRVLQAYPSIPPKIHFTTPVYHPNIDSSGMVAMPALGNEWSPALTIEKVLQSVLLFLDEPNPNDPLRPEVAEQYQASQEAYRQAARKATEPCAV